MTITICCNKFCAKVLWSLFLWLRKSALGEVSAFCPLTVCARGWGWELARERGDRGGEERSPSLFSACPCPPCWAQSHFSSLCLSVSLLLPFLSLPNPTLSLLLSHPPLPFIISCLKLILLGLSQSLLSPSLPVLSPSFWHLLSLQGWMSSSITHQWACTYRQFIIYTVSYCTIYMFGHK